MNERGPLRIRYEVSEREQRALARVRTISALLAFAGAVTMLLGRLPVPVFLLALLGLLISVVWLRQAQKARRAAGAAHRDALQVHEGGLFLDEAERTAWVPWSEVEDIVVDEERLDVVVIRRGTPALRIEPRFPGVDIYELMRTLNDARMATAGSERRTEAEPPDSAGWRR
jgi:uncharacterized iron-regulated membrane protein